MKNIVKIIKISKPLYKLAGIIAFLIVAVAVIDITIPLLSKLAVDQIQLKIAGTGGDISEVIKFALIAFAIASLGTVLSSMSDRLGDHFGGKLRKFLTEKFYDKVLRLPQSYFDSEISGKILNQLSRGIASIQDFMNTATNFILPTFLQSILVIFVLARINLLIGFFVFLLFPVYLVLSYYSSKKWGVHEEKKNVIEDKTRGRLQEVVSNIKLVKSFTNEKTEYDIVSGNLSDINAIYAKQSREYHIFNFVRNASLNLILLGVNIVVFYNTFNGTLTFGDLVLILELVNQARRPLFAMSFILGALQRAETGSKEFLEILELESKEDYTVDSKSAGKIKDPVLEFKDVSFGYTEESVLEKLSFKIQKNEIVALVGPSGAGKSTLVNLILKFYNPTSGEMFLNSKDFSQLDHKFVRENVSLVFQENELFSATIRENVAYGIKATDEEVISALKLANAYDFVSKLKNGINEEIGERGVKLSGGQRQRIQIARAVLKNSPILILDEATSNLDAKSEFEVQDALDKLFKGKLVIIIAHRFSTLQNATKVIVLNNKQIENIDTPNELAKKEGLYKELLNYQIEGNKKLLEKFEIY